jgi:hypothetical protein
MDKRGRVVALVFLVQLIGSMPYRKKPIDIEPKHWRAWNDGR